MTLEEQLCNWTNHKHSSSTFVYDRIHQRGVVWHPDTQWSMQWCWPSKCKYTYFSVTITIM